MITREPEGRKEERGVRSTRVEVLQGRNVQMLLAADKAEKSGDEKVTCVVTRRLSWLDFCYTNAEERSRPVSTGLKDTPHHQFPLTSKHRLGTGQE